MNTLYILTHQHGSLRSIKLSENSKSQKHIQYNYICIMLKTRKWNNKWVLLRDIYYIENYKWQLWIRVFIVSILVIFIMFLGSLLCIMHADVFQMYNFIHYRSSHFLIWRLLVRRGELAKIMDFGVRETLVQILPLSFNNSEVVVGTWDMSLSEIGKNSCSPADCILHGGNIFVDSS